MNDERAVQYPDYRNRVAEIVVEDGGMTKNPVLSMIVIDDTNDFDTIEKANG